MSRISREQMFMDICDVISRRSTCGRQNVGAILVHENKIVSIGYNGPGSGEPHCKGPNCELTPSGGCARSIHAESNALGYLKGSDKRGLTLFTTLSPCIHCAGEIITSSAVQAVYFKQEYRVRDGIDLLIAHGIPVYRITPAGYTLNVSTNQFVSGPFMLAVPIT